MGILDYFTDWMQNSMDVQVKTSTYSSGRISNTDWKDIIGLKDINCALWTKSQTSSIVNDRIKDEADFYIVVDPADLNSNALKDTYRAMINSTPYYFLDPDNILSLDEVILIPATKEDNNE